MLYRRAVKQSAGGYCLPRIVASPLDLEPCKSEQVEKRKRKEGQEPVKGQEEDQQMYNVSRVEEDLRL